MLRTKFRNTTLIFALLALAACATAPPNLSPVGTAAFHGTQAIKSLDVLRDIAISANEQSPPLLSTDTTRQIVNYHKSAITIIHDVPNGGWRKTIITALDEVVKNLAPNDKALLMPYVSLIKTVAAEVTK